MLIVFCGPEGPDSLKCRGGPAPKRPPGPTVRHATGNYSMRRATDIDNKAKATRVKKKNFSSRENIRSIDIRRARQRWILGARRRVFSCRWFVSSGTVVRPSGRVPPRRGWIVRHWPEVPRIVNPRETIFGLLARRVSLVPPPRVILDCLRDAYLLCEAEFARTYSIAPVVN